jgi:putative flavoprotein involved in K+ transport
MTNVAIPLRQEQAALDIAAGWLVGFGDALERADLAAIEALLAAECWWRDTLALTWDLRSLHGFGEIRPVLEQHLSAARVSGVQLMRRSAPQLIEPPDGKPFVQAFYEFKTATAHGRGHVRLVSEEGEWKAWTVLTDMLDLIGHEESYTVIADAAQHQYTDAVKGRLTWPEYQEQRREFAGSEPTALVIGAGHSGLMLAARLERLGVPTLVVDKNERLGDNWRNRYHALALHDVYWASQFPYVQFPSNWPVFTPKDLIADWIEAYAWMLQLRTWTSTKVLDASYDDAGGRWTVRVERDGAERTLRPAHLVFATGNSGDAWMPEVPGRERFRGEIVHSSRHEGGERMAGKKVLVIGSATSAHDIAQDAQEQGAESVTMVQRGPTYIMTAKNGSPIFYGDTYSETSPPVDEADLTFQATPFALMFDMAQANTKAIAEADKELLDGLTEAGFELTYGENWGGLLPIALQRAGGYYIDKGCSQLVADGKIALKRGEIREFTESGVVFSDGTAADADVVAFATGWLNMREAARPICGDEVADALSPVWGQDDEGELRSTWRRSGHPHLWFMAGSFQLCRIYSKHTALQILGVELGLIDD